MSCRLSRPFSPEAGSGDSTPEDIFVSVELTSIVLKEVAPPVELTEITV